MVVENNKNINHTVKLIYLKFLLNHSFIEFIPLSFDPTQNIIQPKLYIEKKGRNIIYIFFNYPGATINQNIVPKVQYK